jgi:hypothetical protein
MFFVNFHTFGFILKKYASVTIDMHFSAKYVITKAYFTHAHSVYAVI